VLKEVHDSLTRLDKQWFLYPNIKTGLSVIDWDNIPFVTLGQIYFIHQVFALLAIDSTDT
jgi:hypothetical protein